MQAFGHDRRDGFKSASPVRPPIDEYEHMGGGPGPPGGMDGVGAGARAALHTEQQEEQQQGQQWNNAATAAAATTTQHYAEMNAMLRQLHFARIQRYPMPPQQQPGGE